MTSPLISTVASLSGHTDRAWHVSFHPTLFALASCGGDRTVRIWGRSAAGAWLSIATLEDFSSRTVRCVEWSPCGRLLAAASFDGKVTVWSVRGSALCGGDVGAGTLRFSVAAVLEGHENEVKGVAWSASGELLATCGRDKSVWVWELVEEEGGGVAATSGDEEGFDRDGNGFDRDGNGADGDNDAVRSNIDFECIAVLAGHDGDVKSLAFHPTDDLLVSTSYDDSLRVWTPDGSRDWVLSQVLPAAHSSTAWAFAWAPDGMGGISAGDDCALRPWVLPPAPRSDVPRALASTAAPVERAHARTVYSVAVAPDGRFAASAGADDALHIWSRSSSDGTLVLAAALEKVHAGDVNCVRWCAKEHGLIATAGDDGVVLLLKVDLR